MSLKMRPLNDELIDTIVKAVNLGMPPSIAANSLGIPASTFRRWMCIGDAEVSGVENDIWRHASKRQRAICGKLSSAVDAAKGKLVQQLVANLRKKSLDGGPWQIDAWLLERLFPDLFALANNVRVSGSLDMQNSDMRQALNELMRNRNGQGENER